MFFNKKKKEEKEKEEAIDKTLTWILIEIENPTTINIKPIKQKDLPENLPLTRAVEIKTINGERYPGFLVIKNNLDTNVNVPLLKDLLEKNRYIALSVRDIYKTKIDELQQELIDMYNVAVAGRVGYMLFSKMKVGPSFFEKYGKWVIVLLILAVIGGAIMMFYPTIQHILHPVQTTHVIPIVNGTNTTTPKPIPIS